MLSFSFLLSRLISHSRFLLCRKFFLINKHNRTARFCVFRAPPRIVIFDPFFKIVCPARIKRTVTALYNIGIIHVFYYFFSFVFLFLLYLWSLLLLLLLLFLFHKIHRIDRLSVFKHLKIQIRSFYAVIFRRLIQTADCAACCHIISCFNLYIF